jgi:hypothetical protein
MLPRTLKLVPSGSEEAKPRCLSSGKHRTRLVTTSVCRDCGHIGKSAQLGFGAKLFTVGLWLNAIFLLTLIASLD